MPQTALPLYLLAHKYPSLLPSGEVDLRLVFLPSRLFALRKKLLQTSASQRSGLLRVGQNESGS